MEKEQILPRKQFAILRLYIDSEDQELLDLYEGHIKNHNRAMFSDVYANSGFDLFVPQETVFEKDVQTQMVSMQVKTEMTYCDVDRGYEQPTGFLMHPRSSLSKTPLMLANHTGIIDSGYRGWLIGAFRWLKSDISTANYVVEKHTRLLQVCHPSLCPIFVELVNDENSLSTTVRGSGGFGSTGLVA